METKEEFTKKEKIQRIKKGIDKLVKMEARKNALTKQIETSTNLYNCAKNQIDMIRGKKELLQETDTIEKLDGQILMKEAELSKWEIVVNRAKDKLSELTSKLNTIRELTFIALDQLDD